MDSVDRSAPSSPAVFHADVFCPECGYNLRGLSSNRCPECGDAVDELRHGTSRIPWVHRAELGWFRGYWRTVALVMFQGKRFCAEIARPVDDRAAQSFRRATIALAYAPLPLATAWVYFVLPPAPFGEPVLNDLLRSYWPVVAIHLLFVLFLAAATGAPSYLFQPRSLDVSAQNKAIALSYYTSGSLAVTGIPIFSATASLSDSLDARWRQGLSLLALLVTLAQWLGWWIDLMRIHRRVMPRERLRRAAACVLVPILWLLCFVAVFGGLGLCIAFVFGIVYSLR